MAIHEVIEPAEKACFQCVHWQKTIPEEKSSHHKPNDELTGTHGLPPSIQMQFMKGYPEPLMVIFTKTPRLSGKTLCSETRVQKGLWFSSGLWSIILPSFFLEYSVHFWFADAVPFYFKELFYYIFQNILYLFGFSTFKT